MDASSFLVCIVVILIFVWCSYETTRHYKRVWSQRLQDYRETTEKFYARGPSELEVLLREESSQDSIEPYGTGVSTWEDFFEERNLSDPERWELARLRKEKKVTLNEQLKEALGYDKGADIREVLKVYG